MSIETLTIKPLRKIKIIHEGYNMSIIVHPENKNHYLGTIRTKVNLVGYDYPTIENNVYLLKLDSSFQILESHRLQEPNRTKHESYTTGIEDCRLINEKMMTGVLLDNNENWLPEMCLCHIDRKTYKIEKITVFDANNGTPNAEKNWLVLHATSNILFMIHSYDPLRIMSVNIENGNSHVVHFQKIFNLDNCDVHGGACVYLELKKKYLVNIRIVNDHQYAFSYWILLTEQYKLCGMSKAFVFSEKVSDDHYEMCMSLLVKNNFLYASVSMNDDEVYVYEFLLDDILNNTSFENIKLQSI